MSLILIVGLAFVVPHMFFASPASVGVSLAGAGAGLDGLPALWPLQSWFLPTLGAAGLIGSGLDLMACDASSPAPRPAATILGLILASLSLGACLLGLSSLCLGELMSGWSVRGIGWVVGFILAGAAGIYLGVGWVRLSLHGTRTLRASDSHRQRVDGPSCVFIGLAVAGLLLKLAGSPMV